VLQALLQGVERGAAWAKTAKFSWRDVDTDLWKLLSTLVSSAFLAESEDASDYGSLKLSPKKTKAMAEALRANDSFMEAIARQSLSRGRFRELGEKNWARLELDAIERMRALAEGKGDAAVAKHWTAARKRLARISAAPLARSWECHETMELLGLAGAGEGASAQAKRKMLDAWMANTSWSSLDRAEKTFGQAELMLQAMERHGMASESDAPGALEDLMRRGEGGSGCAAVFRSLLSRSIERGDAVLAQKAAAFAKRALESAANPLGDSRELWAESAGKAAAWEQSLEMREALAVAAAKKARRKPAKKAGEPISETGLTRNQKTKPVRRI
jgi:hypothetical protein